MTLGYLFLGGSRLGHLDGALQPAGMLSRLLSSPSLDVPHQAYPASLCP